jgi:vacuolar-type H+-ATPase subunit I/STV1
MKDFGKENLNSLVPELLGKTQECAQNLQDRVKINGIFSEFDAYTHGNFQKFIDMSQQRYKSIKSGNHLEKKLESQKIEYNDISSQILANRFYNNNEIEKESKKLLKKMNQKQSNKEISELRKHIIQKTKDFTQKEVIKRERLASAALARRKQSEINRLAHRITRRDLVYRPESMKKKSYSKEFMPIKLNENKDKKKK